MKITTISKTQKEWILKYLKHQPTDKLMIYNNNTYQNQKGDIYTQGVINNIYIVDKAGYKHMYDYRHLKKQYIKETRIQKLNEILK